MNVLTDPISIWHLLLVVGVIWLYFWNEQRKLKQEIKEHGERVEELCRENAERREEVLSTRNHSERHRGFNSPVQQAVDDQ